MPNDNQDMHCFMPAYPLCRSLPVFKADKEKDKVAGGPAFAKYHCTHPGLTPGTFTVFCAHVFGIQVDDKQRGLQHTS